MDKKVFAVRLFCALYLGFCVLNILTLPFFYGGFAAALMFFSLQGSAARWVFTGYMVFLSALSLSVAAWSVIGLFKRKSSAWYLAVAFLSSLLLIIPNVLLLMGKINFATFLLNPALYAGFALTFVLPAGILLGAALHPEIKGLFLTADSRFTFKSGYGILIVTLLVPALSIPVSYVTYNIGNQIQYSSAPKQDFPDFSSPSAQPAAGYRTVELFGLSFNVPERFILQDTQNQGSFSSAELLADGGRDNGVISIENKPFFDLNYLEEQGPGKDDQPPIVARLNQYRLMNKIIFPNGFEAERAVRGCGLPQSVLRCVITKMERATGLCRAYATPSIKGFVKKSALDNNKFVYECSVYRLDGTGIANITLIGSEKFPPKEALTVLSSLRPANSPNAPASK
jgi:hypothetical protein